MALLYLTNKMLNRILTFRPCQTTSEKIISIGAKYFYDSAMLTLDALAISLSIGIISGLSVNQAIKKEIGSGAVNGAVLISTASLAMFYLTSLVPFISLGRVGYKYYKNRMVIWNL
jgi:hypothetical protein